MLIQAHILLDHGIDTCPSCDDVGSGRYCRQCGATRERETTYECSECKARGIGPYCMHCGAVLHSSVASDIQAGTFDWDAWEKSLAPFMGGLSPREQAVAEREGLF